MNKPQRNDPCPCGSGKKYKKCCRPSANAARPRGAASQEHFITEIRPDLDNAVDRVLQAMERGETKRAETETAQLLERHPDYHMTNYAMGVYQAMVAKQPAAAIPFFKRAVTLFPPFPEAHFNLGLAARKTADILTAVESLRAAEKYSNDDGIAEMARKELNWLEQILLKSSPFPSVDAYLANARLFDRAFQCLNDRQFDEAVELFQRVLSENPKHVQSYGNLGLAYIGLGRRADALACFDRALKLDPSYEPSIINRRVAERMREGKPLIPDEIQSVEFYTDRLRAAPSAGSSGATGV